MRCKYCDCGVNLITMTRHGVCAACALICQGLERRSLTSWSIKRILKDIRPEEQWEPTWGRVPGEPVGAVKIPQRP